MPSVNVVVPHTLTSEEASQRLKTYLDKAMEKYGDKVSDLKTEITDNALNFGFKAMGFATSGSLTVDPDAVRVDAKLPLAAMMFKGQIEQAIRDNLGKVLS